MNLLTQLNDLRRLEPGWLEGAGKTPPHEGLDWLSEQFALHYPNDIAPPFATPTADGGVHFEWNLKPVDASLDIDLINHTAYWHVLNLDTDYSSERTLNLNIADDWAWISQTVRGRVWE